MKIIICVIVTILISDLSSATDLSDIYKVKLGRTDDVLVRYIEKFCSICFSLQILEPGSWRVLSEREFCDVNGKVFGSDFMDFSFEEIFLFRRE